MADGAIESALRALRARDRSAHELDRRLQERGFDQDERERALETLERIGLLDDVRFAHGRADSLARRGAGDQLITHSLVEAGIHAEAIEEALGSLEPEPVRARRIVSRRGGGPKTARYLRARGFAPETVSGAVAAEERDEIP